MSTMPPKVPSKEAQAALRQLLKTPSTHTPYIQGLFNKMSGELALFKEKDLRAARLKVGQLAKNANDGEIRGSLGIMYRELGHAIKTKSPVKVPVKKTEKSAVQKLIDTKGRSLNYIRGLVIATSEEAKRNGLPTEMLNATCKKLDELCKSANYQKATSAEILRFKRTMEETRAELTPVRSSGDWQTEYDKIFTEALGENKPEYVDHLQMEIELRNENAEIERIQSAMAIEEEEAIDDLTLARREQGAEASTEVYPSESPQSLGSTEPDGEQAQKLVELRKKWPVKPKEKPAEEAPTLEPTPAEPAPTPQDPANAYEKLVSMLQSLSPEYKEAQGHEDQQVSFASYDRVDLAPLAECASRVMGEGVPEGIDVEHLQETIARINEVKNGITQVTADKKQAYDTLYNTAEFLGKQIKTIRSTQPKTTTTPTDGVVKPISVLPLLVGNRLPNYFKLTIRSFVESGYIIAKLKNASPDIIGATVKSFKNQFNKMNAENICSYLRVANTLYQYHPTIDIPEIETAIAGINLTPIKDKSSAVEARFIRDALHFTALNTGQQNNTLRATCIEKATEADILFQRINRGFKFWKRITPTEIDPRIAELATPPEHTPEIAVSQPETATTGNKRKSSTLKINVMKPDVAECFGTACGLIVALGLKFLGKG